jgi:hypothetical protein
VTFRNIVIWRHEGECDGVQLGRVLDRDNDDELMTFEKALMFADAACATHILVTSRLEPELEGTVFVVLDEVNDTYATNHA